MANRGFPNGQKIMRNVVIPVQIDCNFVVDSTNGNGLGIRSLKSNGYVKNVYMHTSATPAVGNPNPAVGNILVQMADNYNVYLGGFNGFVSPVSGTPLTAVVAGNPYVIVSLGTATLAQWLAVGFPAGFAPAVGAAFIATASATIGGSAAVEAPSVSGVQSVEVVGDVNQTIANTQVSVNGGAQLIMQVLNGSNVVTAPANGSVIGMSFIFDSSSVTVDGL